MSIGRSREAQIRMYLWIAAVSGTLLVLLVSAVALSD
jgi:hypothetical protein